LFRERETKTAGSNSRAEARDVVLKLSESRP
jgi:hypothetical protein